MELRAHARALYELIAGGCDGLGYNVHGVPSVTAIGADGKRRPMLHDPEDNGQAWRPARELVRTGGERGAIVPRRFTPQTCEAHIRGRYSVAPEAAGWVQWVALDIDAHAVGDETQGDAERRARGVLAEVLAALGCGGGRWPVLLRSPGGGFHVWLPLTRLAGGDQHLWPAAVAASWVRDHLIARGVELRDGRCEVYPAGRRLRAPLARGSVLLRVVGADVRDPFALAPWPGTTTTRILWSQGGVPQVVRRVGPMAAAFLGEWATQRRTIADWIGCPEAAWDPVWGFLEPPAEKKGAQISGSCKPSQQVDDVSGASGHEPTGSSWRGRRGGRGRAVRDPAVDRFSPSSFSNSLDVDAPPVTDETGAVPPGVLLKGPAFWRKVTQLLAEGVTEPATRHDAVMVLTFAWGAAAGCDEEETIGRVVAWCGAHAHTGSRYGGSFRFTRECVREARAYFRRFAPLWPFRGSRGAASPVALGILTAADRIVVDSVDPRVRPEVAAILAFLVGRARGGVVADPVEWCASLAERLLGERRIVEGRQRRRAAVIAIEELARLGVLTRHKGHSVGAHGRQWSCWYRFGSGELPVMVTIARATWDAAGRREPLVPSLAMPAVVVVVAAPDASGAPASAFVELRQVATRPVREGVLVALSEAGGPVRVILEPGPWIAAPARPGYRPSWWLRQYRGQGAPSVSAFAHAHEGGILFGARGVAERIARRAARARAAAAGVTASAGSYDPAPAALAPRAVELPELPELAGIASDLVGVLGNAWAAWERSRGPGSA